MVKGRPPTDSPGGAAHLPLAADEFSATLCVPRQPKGNLGGYRKARVRGAMDSPRARAEIRAAFDGEKLASLRVALTGTNSRPLLLEGTEALHSAPVEGASLTALGKGAAANR